MEFLFYVLDKSIKTYDYIITLSKRKVKKTYFNLMRIWSNLNPLYPRMLCAKFGWNWPSGSGEKDFLISSMYFRYFIIISPWKRRGPSLEQIWIPFTQGWFVPSSSLTQIDSMDLEKIFKFCNVFCYFVISSLGKGQGPSFEQIWIHPRVWLKLAQWFWRRFQNFVNICSLFRNYLPL